MMVFVAGINYGVPLWQVNCLLSSDVCHKKPNETRRRASYIHHVKHVSIADGGNKTAYLV